MAHSAPMERSRWWWRLPDVAGLGVAVAGLLSGLVMIVLSPFLSFVTGIGIWEPPKLIAATVYGSSVLDRPGFVIGPVLVGTAIHLVTSLVLGFLFGLFFHRFLHMTTDFGMPMLFGLCYGLVIFVIAYFLILPVLNVTLLDSSQSPVLAQNMIYGICLGLFYTWLRPEPYDYARSGRRR